MFLSSYENLRKRLIKRETFSSLIHLGRGVFGADFGTVAFVIHHAAPKSSKRGVYRRLFEKGSLVRDPSEIQALFENRSYGFHSVNQNSFLSISGAPIAYWLSENFMKIFSAPKTVEDISSKVTKGIFTGQNNRFLRFWYEVDQGEPGWHRYDKAGEARRWFGSARHVLNWLHDGSLASSLKCNTQGPSLRANKSETFDCMKFTLEGAGE